MSKCKYVICNTGNCSLWIALYRGNTDNFYQIDKKNVNTKINHTIVVSRYSENVEWSKKLKNTIIYNKGPKLEGNYNEILLKNVVVQCIQYFFTWEFIAY